MTQQSFAQSGSKTAWYQAANLTERLTAGSGVLSNIKFDAIQAAKHLERWRGQAALDNAAIFKQRLALDNLTEVEFLQLLGESPAGLQSRFSETPVWLIQLEEAFSSEFSPEEARLPLAPGTNRRVAGFLELIRPFIAQARRHLYRGLDDLAQTYVELPFDPSNIAEILLEGLAERLINQLCPTLVLEMQLARLSGKLSGPTPEARFDDFISLLQQPAFALALLQEYNVLARQIMTTLQNQINFRLEFGQKLCQDWSELQAKFSPKAHPGHLVKLTGDHGDGHRDGRTVLIAEFSSGLRLVYKPRSLAADLHFQELLAWLNQRGTHLPFNTLQILERTTYGWMEFVEPHGCTNPAEIRRFYERQGGYLALLYALGATDLHFENVLAAGEQPQFIDLETLFHPELNSSDPTQADGRAYQAMGYSVLQVGLLPQRIWTNKDAAGVEISGLGGAEGQLSPQPLPVWEGAGTDQMRRAYKRLPLGGSQHRPTLNGTKVDPLDYVDDLTSGFCNLYRLLITYRTELLAEDGPLARFKDDTTRVVARPTRIYQLLLENSIHPDRLRNALERDRLFDKLWFEIKQRPFLARLIAAERHDLHRGDFPIFTARPASTTLWTSTGQPIVDFLREPALTQVQRRLQTMGEADLTRQLWFIRASLAILATGNESQVQGGSAIAKPAGGEEVSREKLLVEARAIGDRLEALALWGEQDVTWIGLSLENLTSWNLAPLNLSLYDGLPGVALFLAYLGDCTGETRYSILARAALANIRRQIELKKASLMEIGGFEGWGGVIYTLSHLSKLWNDPTLLDEAENLTELLPPLIEKDIHLDYLTGTAGCISALLSLYHCRPGEQTLAVARRGGEYLLARAVAQKVGRAWQTPMPASQPAIGLGRGSTGMGYALLQLAAVTGDTRFGEVGRAALAYEQSVFSPAQNNWPDFRTAGKDPLPAGTFRYMSAWCHGAPGIGLARQALMTNYSDPAMRVEVEAAVSNTLEKGYGANHSLCHGDMGNLDLLVEVSRKFKDSQLAGEVQHWTTAILADVEQRGWVCSNPLGVETPGFMVGLAGIGYELLRLADPERIPSALILEPPR